MDTHVRTPMAIFSQPQRLVVPIFQRPYVWNEEQQWAPLWQDVRRLAERRAMAPTHAATHFLGAVVIQAGESSFGSVPIWSVIDGQQRLTTLQIIVDAAGAAFEALALEQLHGQMLALTQNPDVFVSAGDNQLKLRHSNRDAAAFEEVMLAGVPVAYDELRHSTSLMVGAHRYFFDRAHAWVTQDDASDEQIESRARALAWVLTLGLQLVVIDLGTEDNSQEIFETLNARGTPLTAADLIKNFVFQRLALRRATPGAPTSCGPSTRPSGRRRFGRACARRP